MIEPSIEELIKRCDQECRNMGCRLNEDPCDMQFIKAHLRRLQKLDRTMEQLHGIKEAAKLGDWGNGFNLCLHLVHDNIEKYSK